MNQLDNFIEKGLTFLNFQNTPFNIFVYIIFAILLLITIIKYFRYPKYKYPLFLIRLLTITTLFLIFLEPAKEYVKYDQNRGKIIFMVDNSESMTLPFNKGVKRYQQIKSFILRGESFIKKISKKYNLFFYRFGKDSFITHPNNLYKNIQFDKETYIIESIKKIVEDHNISKISSILIGSDFIDTDRKDFEKNRIFTKLNSYNIPINMVIPKQKTWKDITIESLKYDSYAFVQNTTSIDIKINAIGFKKLNTEVKFYREGELIDRRNLYFEDDISKKEVVFKFKPEKVGTYVYKVEIPVEKGESLETNNVRYFIIKVVRDKIRVVQVAGRPSWDVRFLRQMLKNHPDVDLVCFFILRTINDISLVPASELSLIPFPTYELFKQKLNSFDLIIFQNFEYAPYHLTPFLDNIKNFVVKRGGGLVMVGGDKSFTGGRYGETIFNDILPVNIPTDSISKTIYKKFTQLNITKNGFDSPFFKFNTHPDVRNKIIKKLPKVEGFNITSLKKDATLLAETAPILEKGGKKYPLIAIRKVKKGRTMAITTDSLWSWNFHKLSTLSHNQLYTYFWDKAIKWLIQDPDLNLIKISIDKKEIEPGDTINFVVRSYNFNYEFLKKGKIFYKIINIESGEKIAQKDLTLNDEGVAIISQKIDKSGAYKIDVTSFENGNFLDKSYEIFLSQKRSKEFDTPVINYNALNNLKNRYKNINIINSSSPFSDIKIKKMVNNISERVYKPIWDNYILLIIVIFLFLLEIYFKRYLIR